MTDANVFAASTAARVDNSYIHSIGPACFWAAESAHRLLGPLDFSVSPHSPDQLHPLVVYRTLFEYMYDIISQKLESRDEGANASCPIHLA
jgi:hypothetical protein